MSTENTMRHIRHFFWDFDGTLFDTYPIIIQILRRSLGEFGHDCDPMDAMKQMLDSIGAAQIHYAQTFAIPLEELKRVYRRHRTQETEELLSKPFPDVERVLAGIVEKGGKNYIFTHRKERETRDYLKKYGLESCFEDILGNESEGFATKPAPDALLYLMEKHGIDPTQAVMVGDRDCDLGSGRNAGLQIAHFVCAAFPENLECDWRFTSFSEMLTML